VVTFWLISTIVKSKILKRLWKYIIKHIPIKQVWLEENIILIKDVQIWVHQKMFKNTMKKRFSIIYQRTKIQKLGNPKNERVEKT